MPGSSPGMTILVMPAKLAPAAALALLAADYRMR
jgi:hypothetical protein